MRKVGLTLNTNEVKVLFSDTKAILTFNRVLVDDKFANSFTKSTGELVAYREVTIVKEQPLSGEFKLTHVDNYIPNDTSIIELVAFAFGFLGMSADGDFVSKMYEHIDENDFQYRVA